jgi:hypothetical protein
MVFFDGEMTGLSSSMLFPSSSWANRTDLRPTRLEAKIVNLELVIHVSLLEESCNSAHTPDELKRSEKNS